jgi:MarR family transcriptional regulator, organic hydroperoxide resistance regulator
MTHKSPNQMPTHTAEPTVAEENTAEIHALRGVFALYWRIDEAFGQLEFTGGLGRVECFLLMQLDCPRRMGELARILLMVPSTVTSAADRLEQEGLALRVRDEHDRRAFRLQLTPKGRSLRLELEKRAGRAFRQICGLNAEEIQEFAVLSGKIHQEILGPAEQRPDKET